MLHVQYNGHIYLLQNDLGYISSDIVWKQLDGVCHSISVSTVFRTGPRTVTDYPSDFMIVR